MYEAEVRIKIASFEVRTIDITLGTGQAVTALPLWRVERKSLKCPVILTRSWKIDIHPKFLDVVYSYIQNDRPLLKKYTHCGAPTFDF
jgi:hypothetical protein